MDTQLSNHLDHITEAAEILNHSKAPIHDRLTEASLEFWAAMFDAKNWPPELLGRANEIVERLLSNGTIRDTIRSMDPSMAEEVGRDIQNLAADLRAVENKARSKARIEAAVERFNEGRSGSQAILLTYGPLFGLDSEMASKIAVGFDWGMGQMAETCAAATGAFMILGLSNGSSAQRNGEAEEKTYESVRNVAARFKTRYGSLACRDLLGCDVSTPEGCRLAKETRPSKRVCSKYVRTAAEALEELL